MKNKYYLVIGVFVLAMIFTGFQCSSTEITSARLYIQQKNSEKAIEALKREIAKNPKSDEGYYLLGTLYADKEVYDSMLVCFKSSLDISKKFEKEITNKKLYTWGELFNKGVAFYQKAGKTEDTDSSMSYYGSSSLAFERAITVMPDSPNTYKYLAYVYLNMGEYDKAIEPLSKLIKLDNSPEGYRFIGEIYFDEGEKLMAQYEESKDEAVKAEAQKKYEAAISILEKGKSLYPNDANILLYLSNSYIAAGKTDVAIKAFKEGVEKEPKNILYRYNYGVLLLGANDFEGATEQFLKALEINPEYINAEYNLAITYVKWGTTLAKAAETEGKTDPEVKVKYNLAVPYLNSYLNEKGDDAAAWELLGKVHSVLGNIKEATDAFDKADSLRK